MSFFCITSLALIKNSKKSRFVEVESDEDADDNFSYRLRHVDMSIADPAADMSVDDSFGEHYNNLSILSKEYLREFGRGNAHDTVFGPYLSGSQFNIGHMPLEFLGIDIIQVGDKNHTLTKGLAELLIMKESGAPEIHESDKLIYGEILVGSGAAYRPDTQNLKANKGHKYRIFVKPSIELYRTSMSFHTGEGIKKNSTTNLKLYVSDKICNIPWWDEPQEILKRLELLVAERERPVITDTTQKFLGFFPSLLKSVS